MRQDSALIGPDLRLGAIARITRPVADIKRTEAWYKDVLGLACLYTFDKLALFDCGGVCLMLEARSSDVMPELQNDFALHFRVADIHAAYDELRRRGAEFTGEPGMLGTHPDGTEEWIAFFRDCEGSALAIVSQVKPASEPPNRM